MKFDETKEYKLLVAQMAAQMLAGSTISVFEKTSNPANEERLEHLATIAVRQARIIIRKTGLTP